MKIDAHSLFSALSNEIRLRCIVLLQLEGELCVCELTHALELSQPMISRHLALLRSSGLVTDRRSGQWIYYQLNPALAPWVAAVLEETAEASRQQSPYRKDLKALARMQDRPAQNCCG